MKDATASKLFCKDTSSPKRAPIAHDRTKQQLACLKRSLSLLIYGLIVGIASGLVVSLFRIFSARSYACISDFVKGSDHDARFYFVILASYVLLALAVGLLINKFKAIRFGGSAWENLALEKAQKQPLDTVLLPKFLGGCLVIGSGISVGGEGPSIQMGASTALAIFEKCSTTQKDRDLFVYGGCAAGLSAIFSAPFGGIPLIFEKKSAKFSWSLMLFLLAGAAGVWVSVTYFFGLGMLFPVHGQQALRLDDYWALIPLGVCCGFIGIVYTILMDCSRKIYARLKILPEILHPLFPFLATAIMFLVYPLATGGGLNIVENVAENEYFLGPLLFFLVIKLLFTAFCFGSGIPAGLMVPLFCVGGVGGGIYFKIMNTASLLHDGLLMPCVLMGMASAFAAAERAPVTSIVLVLEMTGAFVYAPGLIICVLLALATALFMNARKI